MLPISKTQQAKKDSTDGPHKTDSTALALPKTTVMSADLQELDETVKTMMETSENMIPLGKKQTQAKICKVCGKEGYVTDIKRHIEVYHLEGVAIPCSLCDKILRSRNAFRQHVSKDHKEH